MTPLQPTPADSSRAAAPAADLRHQIMSPSIPKNEREWWASRRIDELERLLTQTTAAHEEQLAKVRAERDAFERMYAAKLSAYNELFVKYAQQGAANDSLQSDLSRLTAELERMREDRDCWQRSEATCNEQFNKLQSDLTQRTAELAQVRAELEREKGRLDWLGSHNPSWYSNCMIIPVKPNDSMPLRGEMDFRAAIDSAIARTSDTPGECLKGAETGEGK